MDLQEIKTLIDAMAASDLGEIEFRRGDTVLRLARRGQAENGLSSGLTSGPSTGLTPAAIDPAALTPAPESAAAHETSASAAPAARTVDSPLYGVLHWRPAPDAPPFVEVGQAVKAGQVICVVEAMKVFNEVQAESDGTVVALLVDSGQEVESGQAVLRLA